MPGRPRARGAGAGRVLGRRRLPGPGGLRWPSWRRGRGCGPAASPWITGCRPGSARQAARVAAQLTGLGLEPVRVAEVTVGGRGGPEAAARSARYRALDECGQATGAAAVLLGHTLDDQAETVLLGLARGSGSRSLAGMPERAGIYRRPFLGIGRDRTRAACAALGLAGLGGPAQRRQQLREGPGAPPRPARPGGRAGPGHRRGARAHRRPAPGRRRRPRRAGPPAHAAAGGPGLGAERRCAGRAARRGAHPGAAGRGHRGRVPPRVRSPPGTSPGWTSWSPAGTGSAGQTCPAAYAGCASVGSCGSSPAAGSRTRRPAPRTCPVPRTSRHPGCPVLGTARHPGRHRHPRQEGRGWTRATWEPT